MITYLTTKWFDLIYQPNWLVDENGLNDGEDIMIFAVLATLVAY